MSTRWFNAPSSTPSSKSCIRSKDGNGRIGRLLIPLFLFQKRALASPVFYLSEYLEENRDRYYQHLRAIGTDGGWTGWMSSSLKRSNNRPWPTHAG